MWLINSVKEKMIHKWIVLNLGITLIVIILVGFSIKEFACYQFDLYSDSAIHSEQFRHVIEEYLLYAGILAFFLAVFIHLFFARKILHPLSKLTHFSKKWNQLSDPPALKETSKDEVGQIASDLMKISNQVHHLQQQRDQMMADLAHELRTPLTTLNGYLEGLEDGVFAKDESVTSVLKKECMHLITIIEKINELHKWESEQTELTYGRVQIRELTQSELKKDENKCEQLGIHVKFDVNPAQIISDQYAIRAIIHELLDNVFQYHVGKTVKIEGRNAGEHYVISVSNHGAPIPKYTEKQLFDRFYRIDPSRNRHTGGAGLGLAIAKQIVLRLKGKIGFYSEDDIHTFWFSIPIQREQNVGDLYV